MSGFRLPRGGTRVDRTRPLRFTFDGAGVSGFAGDTSDIIGLFPQPQPRS